MFIVSKTYSEVTPESAAEGDFSDTGFIFEPTIGNDLEGTLSYIQELGFLDYSEFNKTSAVFYGEFHIEDYVTGTEVQYAIHIEASEIAMRVLKHAYEQLKNQK
jgi:hypothetical protein